MNQAPPYVVTADQVLNHFNSGFKGTRLKQMAEEIARLANENVQLKMNAESQPLPVAPPPPAPAQNHPEPPKPIQDEGIQKVVQVEVPQDDSTCTYALPTNYEYSAIYTSDFQDDLNWLLINHGNVAATRKTVRVYLVKGMQGTYQGKRTTSHDIMVSVDGVHVGWVNNKYGELLTPLIDRIQTVKHRIAYVPGEIILEQDGKAEVQHMLPSAAAIENMLTRASKDIPEGNLVDIPGFLADQLEKANNEYNSSFDVASNRLDVQIVGEYYQSSNFAKIFWDLEPGDRIVRHNARAELIPDPTNEYDKNAVEVHIEGMRVGFLPADDAETYAPLIQQIRDAGKHAYSWKTKMTVALDKERQNKYEVAISLMSPKKLKSAIAEQLG